MTAACMVPTAYEAEFGKIVTPPDELRLWRNYQRTLKVDQRVVVPYAGELVDGFPTSNVRARRDFGRMIELIKVCAYAHQHHRDWQVGFDDAGMPTRMVVASVADYEIVKSLVETAMMRVSKNIKPGQEQFIEKLSGLTEGMLDNHRRGEAMPAKVHLEHTDEEGLVVWFEVPFLRDTLGKTHRSVYELVKALEEEGIVILTEKRRPIRVRLSPSFTNVDGGVFRLPTLDPEVLYQKYPDNRKDQYDPLGAPDFEDIYGSPGQWIKRPDNLGQQGKT
jgi:DNA-binding transcriptional ArsR family regulator